MRVQDKTGIPWQAIVAVSANETGWGKAVAGNNYFGIKGSNPTTGANTGAVDTWEVVNGQRVNIKDTFMAFNDYEDSAMGFANFLQSNSRYKPALDYLKKHPNDWRGFLRNVHDAGYATDPNWSDQVINIGNGLDGAQAADPTKPSRLGHDKDTQRTGMTGLLDTASDAIGTKYRFGGAGGRSQFGDQMTPTDCSGFVAWSYERSTGVRLNAQTSSMYKQTSSISPDQAKPGDLIFFNMGEGDHLEHVAIYSGNGMMIHDSSINPNGGVDITPIWQNQGPQFRRVDGVDPSLYSNAQGGGLKPKSSDAANEWIIKVQNGREIMTMYTADGHVRRQDMGKSDKPNGSILGFSGSNAQAETPEAGVGAGQVLPPADTGDDEEDDTDYSFLDTPLSPQGEAAFQIWKARNAPRDSGWDYDLRGAFAAGVTPDAQTGHWPDTYKKPNHPTFSDQSKWAKDYPDKAGSWNGDEYVKPSFLNPSTGNREPLKPTVGAGQDEDQYFFNPSTGNYEPITRPDQIALTPAPQPEAAAPPDLAPPSSDAVPPPPADSVLSVPLDTFPLSTSLRKPITPGAAPTPAGEIPAGLKPGEALDWGVQSGNVPKVAQTGATDVAQAASDMAGGVAQAAGGIFSGLGGALHGGAEAVAQTAGDIQQGAQELNARPGAEVVGDVAQATGEAAGGAARAGGSAASALGTAVSNVPVPEGRSTEDILHPSMPQQPASEDVAQAAGAVGAAANIVQQGYVDQYTKMLQDPGQYAHDLSQNKIAQQAMPGGGELLGMTPGISDSISYLATNGYDMDHLNQALTDMSTPDPARRPASAKVAAGGVLNPLEGAQFITEAMDAHADLRRAIAESVQSPEIRASEEGKWAAEGASFVTDPMNLAMLADPELAVGKAGRIVTLGTEKLPAVLTEDAAKEAVSVLAKHAPEYADFVRPFTRQETETVLQRAALDLNDQTLEDQVKLGRAGLGDLAESRYEPLTGDQVRREVLNAVARTNPGADAETMLARTDDILHGAGMDILTSENAGAYGTSIGEQIGALREMGLAPEARAADRASLGKGAKQAAAIDAKYATVLGGGAAGAGVGLVTEDPNDPNYYGKIAAKTLVGLGSTAGVIYGGAFIPRGVSAATNSKLGGKALYGAREFFAPAMNLTRGTQNMINVWDGQTALGHELGRSFAQQVRDTWGSWATTGTLAHVESTGRLPIGMLTDKTIDYKAARATLDDWIQITKDFKDYGLVPDPLNLGASSKAKVYVPHVVDSSWKESLSLGKGQAQPGRIPSNPFWNYTQQRMYETLDEGMASGVTYLNDDIAGMLGRYYSAGIRARSTANMVDALEATAQINNATHIGGTLAKVALEGEDVVRVPPGVKRPDNSTWLGDIPGIGNKYKYEPPDGERTYVSNELRGVIDNLFNPRGLTDTPGFGPVVKGFMSMNSALKHNTLSGSMFHMINEFRQFSATQGFNGIQNLPTIIGGTLMPGEAKKFWADPTVRGMANQAIKDGLTLSTLAEHDVLGTKTRIATSLLNTAGGAWVGYQTAGAAGLSPEDQAKWTLAGGALGLGATVPGGGALVGSAMKGIETKSLVEAASEALWNRTIPLMKFSTYQMYAPQVGGRAAAEFANTVFGGQNLTAIARSKGVQDIMRMSMLAPDWTEGWARLIGTSMLDTPTGQMSRQYWQNAALQSTFLLEGMNLALGGKFSWQNDPDHVLEVDASNLYDRFGWKTVDSQGRKFTPYIDVLGPYRGLLQPVVDAGRASSVAAAKAAGIDPMSLPGGPAIAGYFPKPGEDISMAIPRPDPGQKLTNFVQARGSAMGSNITQFLDDRDYAGRPLDRNDDSGWQRVLNRVNAAVPHALPTSVSQIIQSGVHGEPPAAGIASAVTGARLTHGNESERFFDMQGEYVKDTGKQQSNWQTVVENNRNANAIADQKVAGLISEQKFPDLTYRDRGRQISTEFTQKVSQNELRLQQIPATLSTTDPTQDTRLRQENLWLDEQSMNQGGNTPADLDYGTSGLNQAELLKMAWDRSPQVVEKLRGGGRRGVASEPGLEGTDELARQRNVWIADAADKYDLDMNSVKDVIKAGLYGEKGNTPPPIPGVTSAQLDHIVNDYQRQGIDDKGEPLDSGAAALAKSKYLSDTVAAINAANPNGPQLDQANLDRRIQLRKLPLMDQSSEQVSYDRAEAVNQHVNQYKYVDENGQPLGDAEKWKDWDNELQVANNRQQRFNGVYTVRDQYGDYVPDGHLNQISDARQRAVAKQAKDVFNGPDFNATQRDAWYKWYGEGSGLTPDQWKQFKDGKLDMWSDASKFGGTLPQDEWNRRVASTRLYTSLTKQERLDWDDQNNPQSHPLITWKGQTDPDGPATSYTGTLTEYMRYLGLVRNKKYSSIKLDPSEPENVSSGG